MNGTCAANLSAKNVCKYKVAVPPLFEQHRIAAFLDRRCAGIDAVIERTRATIEEYKKLKQAVITEAVTKGVRGERKMKDSGIEWIGEIPEGWRVIKFKYLFSIIGGNGFPEHLQGRTVGSYPFCKVSDINGHSDYVATAANYVTDEDVRLNGFNVIPLHSIIIAKIGAALQKNHRKINSVLCCIDNNTQALVPIRNDNIRYLLYLTKCIDMRWFDNNSTVPSLNNSKLMNLFVPDVPIPLFIVNSSSEVDEDITVSIRIEQGIPVEPSKALFHPEYRSANDNTGLEGFVYELGLIKDLLLLPDDRIQYDTDISYSIEDQIIENQRNVQRVFSGRESDATAEDYVREIGKFIAKKKERAIDALYEFEISGLRPQETKWLGPLILVQPTEDGKITIAYTIKSAHSPGIVDGRLMAE